MQFLVKLYDDFLCILGISRHVAHTHTNHHCTVILDVAHLYDGKVKLAIESIAEFLCKFRKMKVEIVAIVSIDTLTKVRKILIGSTHAYSIRTRKHTVATVACRCAGENVDLKFFSFSVKTFSHFCYRSRNHFWSSRGCETGKTNVVAIMKQRCGLLG